MTDQTHPVLVGIDGTASGLEALALGSALALLTGAPLLLGAVYGFEGDYWPSGERAQSWLDAAAAEVGAGIPQTTATVLSTSPARGLTHLAAREHAGIVVLGSSRHGPLGRVLTGSTARAVAHGAPCAVAVAPHGWQVHAADAPLVFGVAFVETPEAQAALALATRLSERVDARLRVLTAVHIPPAAHPMFAATGTSYTRWCRDLRRNAERAAIAAADGGAEVTVLDGDPAEQLAAASGDLD